MAVGDDPERGRDQALEAEELEMMTQAPDKTLAAAQLHRQVRGRCVACASTGMDCHIEPVAKKALKIARARGWVG